MGATLATGIRPVYVDQPSLRVISGPQQVRADALSVLTNTTLSTHQPVRSNGLSLGRTAASLRTPTAQYLGWNGHGSDPNSAGRISHPVNGGPANNRRISQDCDGDLCGSSSGRSTPTRRHRDLSHRPPWPRRRRHWRTDGVRSMTSCQPGSVKPTLPRGVSAPGRVMFCAWSRSRN